MSEEVKGYAKQKKKNAILRTVLIVVCAVLILGIGLYFVLTRFFVVRQVVVQGTDLYPKEAILSVCNVSEGTPLVSLSKKKICRAVEENFPYLVQVSVEYDLPDTVNVTFREEFGELAISLGAELFSIDDDLRVLAKERADSTLERIRLITEDVSRCVVGEKLTFFDESLGKGIREIMKELSAANMLDRVSAIDVRDKFNIKLRYMDRFEILIGEDTDLKYKFAMVKEVIRDLGEGESGRIDISDPNTAYVKLSGQIS